MAYSLYQATVPQLVQIITAALANLDKAEEWVKEQGRSAEDVLDTRLAPDMWPLAKQFQQIPLHSAGAIKAAIGGVFHPDISEAPTNFAALRTGIVDALDYLTALTPEAVDAVDDRDMVLEFQGKVIFHFKGGDFLLTFAQPNFYFHSTTAYAILRSLGMPLGKRTFMGKSRIQKPA